MKIHNISKISLKILISVITINARVTVVTESVTIAVHALVNVVGLEMIAISLLGAMKNSLSLGSY